MKLGYKEKIRIMIRIEKVSAKVWCEQKEGNVDRDLNIPGFVVIHDKMLQGFWRRQGS